MAQDYEVRHPLLLQKEIILMHIHTENLNVKMSENHLSFSSNRSCTVDEMQYSFGESLSVKENITRKFVSSHTDMQ